MYLRARACIQIRIQLLEVIDQDLDLNWSELEELAKSPWIRFKVLNPDMVPGI